MDLIALSARRITEYNHYNIDIYINPNEVSDIVENSGVEPAAILNMSNGVQYNINMSGKRLAQMIQDNKKND